MAAPLQTGKQSVDLASGEVRGSRIRRAPPPQSQPTLKMSIEERDELHRRMIVIGMAAFALAVFVIVLGLGMVGTWSPGEHTVVLEL
jgi:hypothetical protein